MVGTLGLAVDPGIQDSPHEWWAQKTIVEPFVAVAWVVRWTNPGRFTNVIIEVVIFSTTVLNVVGYELHNGYSRCRRTIETIEVSMRIVHETAGDVRSPSSGYASWTGAGNLVRLTTKRAIYRLCNKETLPW